MGQGITKTDITFENCRFHRATPVTKDKKVFLIVNFQEETGTFQVSQYESTLVTGKLLIPKKLKSTEITKFSHISKNDIAMKTKDIYKELRLRGYNYRYF